MKKKSWKTLFLCSGLSKFPLGLAESACSFGALSEISQSEQVSGCCVLFDIVCFLGHCLIGTHMSTPCSSISEAHRLRLEHRLNFCSHSWETKTRVEQLVPALCFYPLLSRILTHTYNTFLPLFSLQSHNEWFHPRTPPPLSLSLQLIPEAPRFPLASFFVLSHFIPMLHSNRVIFFFFSFFPPPSLPLLHLGQQRPTGTYLVSVFIPTARLWPTGKLQSVICLWADKNLPFSSVLVPTLTSKHFTALCLDLRRWSLDRVSYVFVLSPLRSHFRRRFKSWHHSSQRCQCAQWAFLL